MDLYIFYMRYIITEFQRFARLLSALLHFLIDHLSSSKVSLASLHEHGTRNYKIECAIKRSPANTFYSQFPFKCFALHDSIRFLRKIRDPFLEIIFNFNPCLFNYRVLRMIARYSRQSGIDKRDSMKMSCVENRRHLWTRGGAADEDEGVSSTESNCKGENGCGQGYQQAQRSGEGLDLSSTGRCSRRLHAHLWQKNGRGQRFRYMQFDLLFALKRMMFLKVNGVEKNLIHNFALRNILLDGSQKSISTSDVDINFVSTNANIIIHSFHFLLHRDWKVINNYLR